MTSCWRHVTAAQEVLTSCRKWRCAGDRRGRGRSWDRRGWLESESFAASRRALVRLCLTPCHFRPLSFAHAWNHQNPTTVLNIRPWRVAMTCFRSHLLCCCLCFRLSGSSPRHSSASTSFVDISRERFETRPKIVKTWTVRNHTQVLPLKEREIVRVPVELFSPILFSAQASLSLLRQDFGWRRNNFSVFSVVDAWMKFEFVFVEMTQASSLLTTTSRRRRHLQDTKIHLFYKNKNKMVAVLLYVKP